jgi:hypothetical protein
MAAVYQRLTGPTHPVDGSLDWSGTEIEYHLKRSHGGEGDQPVAVIVPDTSIKGFLVYRRYNTDQGWTGMTLQRNGEELQASLPHQPPAGKLEYFLWLQKGEQTITVPPDKSIVTRFTGAVPLYVLLPHVLVMFIAMFLSNAAGLEALSKGTRAYKFGLWATGLLILGGMILGPIVQKFAFDAYWTGIPWGMDLTDNKTLITVIAWLLAVWKGRNTRTGKYWIIVAAVVLLLVYLIPHSMMGSELNYETGQIGTGN